MNIVAHYFSSPNFQDDLDKTRIAQLLHKVLLAGFVVPIISIPLWAMLVPATPVMIWICLGVAISCLVLLKANQHGYVKSAGVGILLVLLAALAVDSVSPGKTLSPAVVMLYFIMAYVGFAFGMRGLVVAAILNSAVLYGLLQVHLSRQPDAATHQELLHQYGVQIFFIWIAFGVFSITVRYLHQTQQALRDRETDLATRNQHLENEIAERRQLTAQLAERTQELSKLLEVTQIIGLRLDLPSLHAVLFEKLSGVMHYDGIVISEFDAQHNLRMLSCAGDVNTNLVGQLTITDPQLDIHLNDLIAHRRPIIIPDISADTPYAKAFRRRLERNGHVIANNVRCVMIVPLVVRNNLIGVMRLMSAIANGYDNGDAVLALAFANQAAMLIESARAHQEDIKAAALKERTRIARELHDSVSQALFGIVLGLRTSLQRYQVQADISPSLTYALTLSEAALAEIRALVFELRPEYLEKEGLIAAFKKQAESLIMRHQLDVKMALGNEEPPLSLPAKEAVYRIGLEALQNTLKHAQATKIELYMTTESKTVILEVKDNGKGFDPSQTFQGHFGLSTMRERAEQFGASVKINSEIGRGTQLQVRMPL